MSMYVGIVPVLHTNALEKKDLMTKEELREILRDNEVIELMKDEMFDALYSTIYGAMSEFAQEYLCTPVPYTEIDKKTGKYCKKYRDANIAEILDRIADHLANMY